MANINFTDLIALSGLRPSDQLLVVSDNNTTTHKISASNLFSTKAEAYLAMAGESAFTTDPSFNMTIAGNDMGGFFTYINSVTGDFGAKGETGATGPTGPTGDKGETGADGPKGSKGEDGQDGQKGEDGTAAAKGDTGPAGAKGDVGPAGDKGDVGPAGDKGDTGATGAKGEEGGNKGDKGEIGVTGAKGEKGEEGSGGGGSTVSPGLCSRIHKAPFVNSMNAIGSTSTLFPGDSAQITLANTARSYVLMRIETNKQAWVTIYSDQDSLNADRLRSINVDPAPGAGVIAEVINVGNSAHYKQRLTPGVIGFNDDADNSDGSSNISATIYAKVVNQESSAQAVTLTAVYLPIEKNEEFELI